MQPHAQSGLTTTRTNGILRSVGRIPLLLFVFWVLLLLWGERWVYWRSAATCRWEHWESWPEDAKPHHVLLVADPQIVDPHTYPGRPWPLSTLTVRITDLYMRRVYNQLLEQLQPHTTLFLGDLFDGGREWGTEDYMSADKRYQQYGTTFWLNEYDRFMKLFVKSWYNHRLGQIPSEEGHRIIASLPGNHDLGFAGGINPQVRERFDAHFGPLNRIDVLGNHTFVSIDTVSLSAMDQADPVTGSSGDGDGTGPATQNKAIWKPAESFLENIENLRAKAVQRQHEFLSDGDYASIQANNEAAFQAGTESNQGTKAADPSKHIVSTLKFPTVLLTHVPLYRSQETTCGPLREKGSAIRLAAGYQYQNVLTPTISADIVKHLDSAQITQIYSGDDHDYCEIEHTEFTGRIKEITVKSISMAMGIRRPGVQLASLWNPVDLSNSQANIATPRNTIQNHLCLLPFQEGIYLRYAEFLGITLLVLLLRAFIYDPRKQCCGSPIKLRSLEKDKSISLLPISQKIKPSNSDLPKLAVDHSNSSSTSSSSSARARGNGILSSYGNVSAASRSTSPFESADSEIYGVPFINSDNISSTAYSKSMSRSLAYARPTAPRVHQSWSLLASLGEPKATRPGEFLRSICILGVPVLGLFCWLIVCG